MDILIKKKPPIYVRKPKPLFRTEVEKKKYWANEKKKWLEGSDGLPGMFYHFLQEQWIKDRVSGKTLIPKAFERDLMVHEEIEKARKSFTPVLILKARGTALSTLGGCAVQYHMRAYPGSTCLVTSADQARISKLYTDKIRVCYDRYDEDIQYDISKYSETMAKTYLQLNIKHVDDYGRETVSQSDMFCNQTNKDDASASSFSGTGAIFGFFDEIALNKRRAMLLQSSESCFIDPNTSERTGLLLAGGTAEDVLTTEDLAQFKLLYDKWIELGWKVVFLPYYHRFHDENGYIDKEAGERWYEREYAAKAKSSDPSDLQAFLKNNPSKLEDIFSLGSTSFFNETAVNNLKVIREKISLNKPDPTYNIAVIGNKAEAVPSNKGMYTIQEHPKPFVKYVMVIDGVATGTDYGTGDSKMAATVIKEYDPETNLPYQTVAVVEWKPQSLEQAFPIILNLARYYNKEGGFRVMHPEASNSTHELLPQYMIKQGLIHWVQHRVDYSKSGNINTNLWGQFMNQHSTPYAIGRWNEILTEYPQGITMLKVLDSMLLPSTANADIRSSMLLFAFLVTKDFGKPQKKIEPIIKRRYEIINQNGANIRVVRQKVYYPEGSVPPVEE